MIFMTLMASLLMSGAASAKAEASIHKIKIEMMKFAELTEPVHANEIILWQNDDLFPHTVTADDHSFNSQTIAAGKSWKHQFKKAGTFPYHCDLHPTMKAQIEVH